MDLDIDMDLYVELWMIGKIAFAAFLGLLLGIEREFKRKPVGVKTSIVIAAAACLLTIVSIESSFRYAEAAVRPMDPLRLAAQIISGIGFIGAGVILRRSNEMISGLTTAAIVWASAAMGIAVGAGFYAEAVVMVLLVIIAVEIIPFLMKLFGPKTLLMKPIYVKIKVENSVNLTDLLKSIKQTGLNVKNLRLKDLEDDCKNMYLEAEVEKRRYTTDVYESIRSIEGVLSAEVQGT